MARKKKESKKNKFETAKAKQLAGRLAAKKAMEEKFGRK
jgi:hypothetical protein